MGVWKLWVSGNSRPFEPWVANGTRTHTQRAYRQDIMAFIRFVKIRWPDNATALFQISVRDVHAWRDRLVADGAAPKTLISPSCLALQLL